MKHRILTTVTAVVLTTSMAEAQLQDAVEDPSAQISYGETLSRFLTATDDSLADGSFYETFLFSGEAGDTATITVNSIDFNAHLLLADSMKTILADDGDSGGLCNAHLTHVLPTSGQYIVYATTFSPRDVGEFSVSLIKGSAAPTNPRPCGGFFNKEGTLTVGDSAMGTLGPPDRKLGPTYYQVWGIDIPRGRTVTIDFQSTVFDARLTLYRGFATAIDANDDGAGACNARLVVTGNGHPHSVVLTTRKEDETGPFVLRVQEGALPIVRESQCEG